MRCAFCNRPMRQAAVFIGLLPVGPTCARKAGLVSKARRGEGVLRLGRPVAPARPDPKTMDLFEEVAA